MLRLKFKKPILIIGIIGNVVITSIAMMLQRSIDNKLKGSSSYHEATKLLYSEEFPRKYLGEPIVEKGINFLSFGSYGTEGKLRWIMLGVEGPYKKGFYKYWFSSDNEGHHRVIKIALLNPEQEVLFDKFIIP